VCDAGGLDEVFLDDLGGVAGCLVRDLLDHLGDRVEVIGVQHALGQCVAHQRQAGRSHVPGRGHRLGEQPGLGDQPGCSVWGDPHQIRHQSGEAGIAGIPDNIQGFHFRDHCQCGGMELPRLVNYLGEFVGKLRQPGRLCEGA
jgi:hypothetical protein